MTAGLYALPIVGRSGLGNMLFPWARAEIFARDHNAQMLEPAWNSIRVGPWLRREPDKRAYFNFFRSNNHVRGLRGGVLRSFAQRVGESEFNVCYSKKNSSTIVIFRGLQNMFEPIRAEHLFIRDRLWRITNPKMRGDPACAGSPFIAMHVRRGDLTRQGLTKAQILTASQYAPLDWYIAMAKAIRSNQLYQSLPIVVFSDGSEKELDALLALPNIQFHRRASAISDMWAISRASVLLAGGASSFAMWASYLGEMPTVYAPGKLLQRVQTRRSDWQEVEVQGNGPELHNLFARVFAESE